MNRKKKRYDDDDGRVIAPMNIEGMPWYIEGKAPISSNDEHNKSDEIKLGKKDTAKLIFKLYALILPVALLFIVALALLIVFVGRPWK